MCLRFAFLSDPDGVRRATCPSFRVQARPFDTMSARRICQQQAERWPYADTLARLSLSGDPHKDQTYFLAHLSQVCFLVPLAVTLTRFSRQSHQEKPCGAPKRGVHTRTLIA